MDFVAELGENYRTAKAAAKRAIAKQEQAFLWFAKARKGLEKSERAAMKAKRAHKQAAAVDAKERAQQRKVARQ